MIWARQLTFHAAQADNSLLQASQRFSHMQGMQVDLEGVDKLSIPAGQMQHMTLSVGGQCSGHLVPLHMQTVQVCCPLPISHNLPVSCRQQHSG